MSWNLNLKRIRQDEAKDRTDTYNGHLITERNCTFWQVFFVVCYSFPSSFDCKNGLIIVRIHSTNYDKPAFVNNKGYHSIHVQTISDFRSKSLLIFQFFRSLNSSTFCSALDLSAYKSILTRIHIFIMKIYIVSVLCQWLSIIYSE